MRWSGDETNLAILGKQRWDRVDRMILHWVAVASWRSASAMHPGLNTCRCRTYCYETEDSTHSTLQLLFETVSTSTPIFCSLYQIFKLTRIRIGNETYLCFLLCTFGFFLPLRIRTGERIEGLGLDSSSVLFALISCTFFYLIFASL